MLPFLVNYKTLMMLTFLIIGILIVVVSIYFQARINLLLIKRVHLKKLAKKSPLTLLIGVITLFTVLHTLQTMIWACAYFFIPELSSNFTSFSEAIYFSMITFTTLGYGDIVLASDGRILSGIEAINGIILIGWSSAMVFTIIQQIIKSIPIKP